jgi:hypothetical protein
MILIIEAMPLEEKYDRLLDEYVLIWALNHSLIKETGTEDKALDLYRNVAKNMLPSVLGAMYKVLKAISPGTAFKEVTDQVVYTLQEYNIPLSNIELVRVSDREALVRIKNCPMLKKMKDVVNKTNLDIDPKLICEDVRKLYPEVAKEFGIDANLVLEEGVCTFRAKLI